MSAQAPPPSPWGTPPPAPPPRPDRPWYKKKRFIIPGAILALFILIGVLNPSAPATPAGSKATSTAPAAEPPTTEAPTTSTPATQPPTTAAPPRTAAPTTRRAPATDPSTTHRQTTHRQTTTTHPTRNCDPSYPDVCLHDGIGDYDCAGGSGNGPNYVDGPIQVRAPDPFGLDRDGDGIGCEN